MTEQTNDIAKALDALQDNGYLPPGAVHLDAYPTTREQAREQAIAKGARWMCYDDGDRATIYDVPRTQLDPVTKEMKRLAGSIVPPTIPDGARACFVTMRPSSTEAARRELLTGQAGDVFAKEYLASMGLERAQVAILATTPVFAVDADGRPQKPSSAEEVEWARCLAKELADTSPAPVFALGESAATFLADHAAMTLPYPSCIKKEGKSATSLRTKIIRAKVLTNWQAPCDCIANLATPHSGPPSTSSAPSGADLLEKPIRVAKADAVQGIVGAVVLRPGVPDAERDLMTPEGVEKAAHLWMRSGGRLKYRHDRFGNRAIEGHTLETAIAKSDFMLGTEQ
ncbi:MAG: XkdF-like putative serine protease domain-containing protein, partial [Nocardioides sp.]